MHVIRIGTFVAAVALTISLSGCGGRTSDVTIDGSSTVYPITEAVAEEYRKVAPRVRVPVGFSGTGGGMKKFISGDIDICCASRTITESEKQACTEAGVEYVELQVAFDGLAVVVHPENDWCDSLTVAQLKELWRPESAIQKWSDLNPEWPDQEIKLFGAGTDSGTFDYFTEAIVGEVHASRSDYSPSEDDNMLVIGVHGNPYALGYFGYAYYAENKEKLKLLGVDNGEGPVKPTAQSVRDGSYAPLSRPLYIYVRKSSLERPAVLDFVRFYIKNAGELVREVGYVPISEQAEATNEQALRQAITAEGPAA